MSCWAAKAKRTVHTPPPTQHHLLEMSLRKPVIFCQRHRTLTQSNFKVTSEGVKRNSTFHNKLDFNTNAKS
ncbi:MAG TPA: hypothetical protein VE732_08850, partial [Nitrososphaera sp.]|nr:hypothetical protein [Nitrososphaera sp.]